MCLHCVVDVVIFSSNWSQSKLWRLFDFLFQLTRKHLEGSGGRSGPRGNFTMEARLVIKKHYLCNKNTIKCEHKYILFKIMQQQQFHCLDKSYCQKKQRKGERNENDKERRREEVKRSEEVQQKCWDVSLWPHPVLVLLTASSSRSIDASVN